MKFKNKRLKDYIYGNTTSITRSRASDCKVVEYGFEESNVIKAIVNGSSGTSYEVSFSGIIEGDIKSSCSCPFDHGNVCKHAVALALETEYFFSEKNKNKNQAIKLHGITPSEPPHLTKKTLCIPLEDLHSNTIDSLVKKFASKTVYKEHENYFGEIILKSTSGDGLEFLVDERWDSPKQVSYKKTAQNLEIQCNCRADNKSLCRHQASTLKYIEQNIPIFLISEELLETQKENILKEYGFDLNDEIYKQYFEFGFEGNKLIVQHKKRGILKLHKNENLSFFKNNFLDSEAILKAKLPFVKKNEKKEREKGFAIIFSPIYSNFFVEIVIGNVSKDKTRLISKIETVEADYFIANPKLFNEKQTAILKKFFELGNLETKGWAKHEILKKQFYSLKEILSQIDDSTLLYRFYDAEEKITPSNIEPILISNKHPRLFFKLTEEKHFFVLKAFIELEGEKTALKDYKYNVQAFFVLKHGEYYFYETFYQAYAFLNFKSEPEIRIPKKDFDSYNQDFIKPLSKQFEVNVSKRKYKKQKTTTNDFIRQVYLSEYEDTILIQPMVEYKKETYPIFEGEYIEIEEQGDFYKVDRDKTLEKHFFETIKNQHPSFEYQDTNFFYLETDGFIEKGWFLDFFENLKKEEIQVFGSNKLSKFKYNTNKPTIETNFNSGIDWFDVEIEIKFGDQLVSLKEVRKSIIKKENFVALKGDSIGILPEQWVQKYSHVFKAGEVKTNAIKVSNNQLSVIDSLYDEMDITSELAVNYKQVKEQLTNFKEISKLKKPRGLKATLRDYQKEGLNWLNFLDEYSFGGCLADDMGLGKTLQVISFLKHLKNSKKSNKATLIILPTSLIFNWQAEIDKFAPSLKFINHTGKDRAENIKEFDKTDLVLTTYGIVIRDITLLKEYKFHYCILDESQAIKNPNSQRFKAIKLIKATNRLVLTGTPIENNTFDLYAQMSFVNPGLLGTSANFKKEFATPIDKDKNSDVANELRKIINPFLLRRTKEQVAKELPEKTEQILYCTMEKEQQKLYDAYKNKYRNYIINKIDENGIGKSKMYVLEGLTKLRQICDSPKLLNDQEKYTTDSIKTQELVKHITEKTGQHKILVFSQFVKMLALVKEALDEKEIPYEYLDGQTKNRQERVDNFQSNNNIRVFLISLKAGGTGLNLTAADYVYIVDPWWNPAVEAQAIDRCYRIGQTKKVMAYKMICKGTVEEKIIQYQEGKKQLSKDIIQTDESFVKNLTKESITDLFS